MTEPNLLKLSWCISKIKVPQVTQSLIILSLLNITCFIFNVNAIAKLILFYCYTEFTILMHHQIQFNCQGINVSIFPRIFGKYYYYRLTTIFKLTSPWLWILQKTISLFKLYRYGICNSSIRQLTDALLQPLYRHYTVCMRLKLFNK